jgi:Predicted transcriptional regulators
MQNKTTNFGQFIKTLREERGVSLEKMGADTGLSKSYINRLENSTRDNPSLDSLARLIKYFGISFSTIEQFCDCGDNGEGTIQNLEYVLLNEKYLFANIEADISLKMILRELIAEIENYCTKASTSRQDEAKLLDLTVLLRGNLLGE